MTKKKKNDITHDSCGAHCVIDYITSYELKKSSSDATTCGTTYATTHPCGELWLVERCPHMDQPLPFHQPQLVTWPSCGQNCVIGYDIKITPF